MILDRIAQFLIFTIGVSFLVIAWSDHQKTLYHFALTCLMSTIGLLIVVHYQDKSK